MTKADLAAAGLPGVKYVYAGNIKYIQKGDIVIPLKHHPWALNDSDLKSLSEQLDTPIITLLEAFAQVHDAVEKQPVGKKQGKKTEDMPVSWENAVDFDAKGKPTGLDHGIIAQLLVDNCARVGDIVLRVNNNIGTILTKEDLKIDILNGLATVGATKAYSMNTYQLVRDQLLPKIPAMELASTVGMLPVKNGVLDICKNEIVPVTGIYLQTLNIPFDPDAKACPKITTMLNNMFLPEQKELVLSLIGAALSGRRCPFILCLSGSGRNGKSLFREILESLMMQLITTEKLENLNKDFVNGIFVGKRISWNTEVSSTRKFTEEIKEVTGGTTIQVRKKFIDGQLQVPLQMIAIIDTNSPPHFDDSQAINDRVRFVNMPHKFVYELTGADNEVLIDANLVEKWELELPAFLNTLLPYARHFLEHGKLKSDIGNTVEQLRERSNLLSGFIDEWCDTSDYNQSVSIQTFIKYYKRYGAAKNVAIPELDHLRYKLRNDFGLKVRGMTIDGLSIRREAKLTKSSE